MAEAQSGNDMNHAILNLTTQEKTAYSYLFKIADTDALGVLTGERAVTFFEKTRVPAPVLGEIWQIADTENRGLLTKPGFCMVMRLIGCFQAGEQPRSELAFKPAPLPKFDGITVPGVEAPTLPRSPTTGQMPSGVLQPQLSGQSTGGGPVRIPPLDPAKVQQYSSLFERSGAQNGVLDGGTAKSIFEKSGLPNEMLGKIWMLSDRGERGALDQTEFIVAMHLLTSVKMRAMTSLPTTLPPALYEAAARRGQRPPSRQFTGPPPGVVSRQLTGGQPPRTQSPLARGTPPPTAGPQWLVTAQEKAQYDRFFTTIDTSGSGVVSGEQAVRFFSDSRLPEDTLASIWDLADINSEGQLNRDEFAVAMYLIRQQRQPNAPPLPAFLPPPLVPPSMRGQQQQPAHPSTAPAFDDLAAAPPSNVPKSAAEDLFGLDEPAQSPQQPFQPQTTGMSSSRDPFSGSQPGSPTSPQRFNAQTTGNTGTTFKPFIPTSAFGASIAQQSTGSSVTSGQGARALPQQQQAQTPQPFASGMDDLLGDSEANTEESSKLTNETSELANMSNQIGNLRTQMEQTQNKKATTQADLTATNNQKKDLEVRLQQFRSQYELEVRTVKDLEQQLAASRESTKKLSQEMAMLEGTSKDLQTQRSSVAQALQTDQQENASLKQRISQINAEVTKLKPEIEKLKMDARQQKGLVSINKKQLATSEGERDRLQSEKSDLERTAAEQARSAAASPDPVATPREVASPALSTMSSTNPFFRKPGDATTATTSGSDGPTPSAFDALFGPSATFAAMGQTTSRSGTPPATSFIGRSLPTASTTTAAGGDATPTNEFGTSVSSDPVSTPSQEPPPPPASRQFTPSHLPITSQAGGEGSDGATSVNAIPPGSRGSGFATPLATPGAGAAEREVIPGAFPDDEPQPTGSVQEVVPSNGQTTPFHAASAGADNHDDFDSAFANFGESHTSRDAAAQDDPFGQSSTQQPSNSSAFHSEFPPIQSLERDDDDSDSDSDDGQNGFDDNFTAGSPEHNAPTTTALGTTVDEAAVAEQPAQDPPSIDQQRSPPAYEQAPGGGIERVGSNQFPPEFEGLLPSREDPTSPPPAESAVTSPVTQDVPDAALSPADQHLGLDTAATPTTEVFHDASSRPLSNITGQGVAPPAAHNAFDEFDDFQDLSEAHEADQTTADGFDLDFGRQSVDEFNPAFDSPAASMTNTPMARSVQQSQDSTNGFANFTPNASTTSAFATSTQPPAQNTQADWDAIFSGLDSSKNIDTSFAGTSDPWGGTSATAANGTTLKTPSTSSPVQPVVPPTGRAITPGTEHDDPILKRLTGMGYARTDALNALEMHDYDINRAVDHLTGG